MTRYYQSTDYKLGDVLRCRDGVYGAKGHLLFKEYVQKIRTDSIVLQDDDIVIYIKTSLDEPQFYNSATPKLL
jgi:hypothetical protein